MKNIFKTFIKVYQIISHSIFSPHCRFHPSCSHYALESVEKYGLLRGLPKAIFRILRCSPFSKGGYDPVE